jgi:hypothetical protein
MVPWYGRAFKRTGVMGGRIGTPPLESVRAASDGLEYRITVQDNGRRGVGPMVDRSDQLEGYTVKFHVDPRGSPRFVDPDSDVAMGRSPGLAVARRGRAR